MSTVSAFLAYRSESGRVQSDLVGVLISSSVELLLYFLMEAFLLSMLRTRVKYCHRDKKKNFACESLGVIMNGTASHSHPLILGSVNHGCGENGTIYWILIQSTYSLLEKLVLALQDIAT